MQSLVHTEKYKSFDVHLYLLQEDLSPRDCIDWPEQELDQLINDIESGSTLWFTAKVCAFKKGIKLATDYLEGCSYNSVNDFIKDAYYEDMRTNVINEAINVINDLKREI